MLHCQSKMIFSIGFIPVDSLWFSKINIFGEKSLKAHKHYVILQS